MDELELRERGSGLFDVYNGTRLLGEVYLKGGARPGWEPRALSGSRVLGRYASKEEAAEILAKAVL